MHIATPPPRGSANKTAALVTDWLLMALLGDVGVQCAQQTGWVCTTGACVKANSRTWTVRTYLCVQGTVSLR